MDVLQLDVSGRPQAWITTREAAVLYSCDDVAWTLGEPCQVLRGGWQRVTGRQSRIEVHPIIAVRGAIPTRAWRQAPALTNSSCSRATAMCAPTAAACSARDPDPRAHPPHLARRP